MIRGSGRRLRRAVVVVGGRRCGCHTVSMTEVTHGVLNVGLSGPNPCSGASIAPVDASGNQVNHIRFADAEERMPDAHS
jgi:hypothetical protein